MPTKRSANPDHRKSKPPMRTLTGRKGAQGDSGRPAGIPLFMKSAQRKLEVGRAGDARERQADRVADLAASGGTPGKSPDSIVRAAHANYAPSAIPVSDAGSPLDAKLRARLEPLLSADLSHVRVHNTPADQELAKGLQARAFTHGQDIWLGSGQSSTDTKLMAHEAAHVVQQRDSSAPAIQREVAPGGQPDPSPGPTPEASSCAGWESDPQSLSKVAAERYVRDHISGLDHGGVQTIICDPGATTPPYTCHVKFGCGMVIDIAVYKGYLWAEVNDASNPKPDAPSCRYDYTCPSGGGLVLNPGGCIDTHPF